ncbi:MAG: diguanylate cyclase [Chloroflexi bacterium]|jgi:diguanylate cyclase (GGDEF)-like protein|nr:diguanylate cyclase [Chloroflexota bacterium]
MTYQRILLIGINLLSTLLALFASISALKRHKGSEMAANFLALSMAGTAIYAFFYAMELAHNTIDLIHLWVKIEHIGIQMIAPFWLLFSLSVSGRQKWISKIHVAILFVIPVLLVISAFAGWMHANPRLTPNTPFPTFYYDKTIWSWLSIIYISICLTISFVLFATMLMKASRPFRKQALILLLGSIIPWIGMLVTQMGISPYNLDLTPFTVSISGIIYLFGFEKYQILDIAPMAKDIIFESMGEGVLVLDNYNRIIDLNPMLCRIFPECSADVVGSEIQDVFHHYPALVCMLRENKSTPIEMKLVHQDSIAYYRCILLPLINPQKETVGKIVTFHDFSETENLIQQLQKLATLDNLTGIYNRRHFYELASKEIARSKRHNNHLALLIFDLDNFKWINDKFGHSAGDAVLVKVVNIFKENLREYDSMGRFGGDEFLILLPETGLDAATKLAEKLRGLLEKTAISFEGHILHITASFGAVDTTLDQDTSFEELVRRADKAVYNAKDTGRNRVCVYKIRNHR